MLRRYWPPTLKNASVIWCRLHTQALSLLQEGTHGPFGLTGQLSPDGGQLLHPPHRGRPSGRLLATSPGAHPGSVQALWAAK